jgi:hypothetical protein
VQVADGFVFEPNPRCSGALVFIEPTVFALDDLMALIDGNAGVDRDPRLTLFVVVPGAGVATR